MINIIPEHKKRKHSRSRSREHGRLESKKRKVDRLNSLENKLDNLSKIVESLAQLRQPSKVTSVVPCEISKLNSTRVCLL